MAVTLRKLLEYVEDQNLCVIAGEKNLDNLVRWTHMVESTEISSFLEGQEIAFTTGVALKSEGELMDVVRSIVEHRASGIIINLGPYIKKVPREAIDYCNAEGVPLMTAPWQSMMAHIMQIFTMKITESDKENLELSAAVKNAIFFADQEELYMPALERYHYSPDWSYCVAMLEVLRGAGHPDRDRRKKLIKYAESQLLYQIKDLIIFELEKRIVIVFARRSEEEIREAAEKIVWNCRNMLSQGEKIFVGVGQKTKNMKCISKSYSQAEKVLKLQVSRTHDSEVKGYRGLGLYKLLLSMDDKEIVKEYYQDVLGRLIQYDETHNMDCCKVLYTYLKYSGSVKDTAEELYVHRNTINKKINKIEEITGCNLSVLRNRVSFSIAFMLEEIL